MTRIGLRLAAATVGAVGVIVAVLAMGLPGGDRGAKAAAAAGPTPAPTPAATQPGPADRPHLPGPPPAAPSTPVDPAAAVRTATGPGWLVSAHRITSGGRQRDFILARPAAPAARPLPVLVALHGGRMGPADMARMSGFPSIVKQAILVYPAGLGDSWNAGACCATAHAIGADDVRFLSDVVTNVLATQHDASPGSVFLVGYSNGGRMAYQMACLRPGMFAAVAAVEAVPVAVCNQTAGVAILVVASTGDPFVNLDGRGPRVTIGGYVEPTVDQVLTAWRTRDGCTAAPKTTVTGQLTTTRWAGCKAGAEVTLDAYIGTRHQWPPGGPGTPSAQAEVWAFFQRHARP